MRIKEMRMLIIMLEKISYEKSQVKNYRREDYFKIIRKGAINLI